MGVVYEGRDPYLDRQVAIKTIRVQNVSPEAAAEFSGRFRTEARSAARLQHPNIVSVFDSGQDGETSYLVMEFIQGDDLKRHLERGAHFGPKTALKMVYDLLMALDHAHRQNVVHRDVKPANMLIEASGRVKLADFGVARIQEPDEGNLTQLGAASVGTPRYMSPEQAQGMRVDARTDVFSAGVVLYELLTGKRPFDGENQFIVVNQIVSHPHVAPTRLNPELPVEIDAVLDKALAKQPEQRYATARDFALALRTVAQQLPESADDTVTNFALGHDSHPSSGSGSRNAMAATSMLAGTNTGATALGTNLTGSMTDATLAIKVNQEIELEYWKDIKDSTEVEDFQGFLGRFPNGIYADRARRRLQRLDAPAGADGAADGSTGSTISGAVPGPLGQDRTVPAAPARAETAPGVAPVVPVAAAGSTPAVPKPQTAPQVPHVLMPSAAKPAANQPAAAAAAPASRKNLYLGLGALVLLAAAGGYWFTGTGSEHPASAPQPAASASSGSASAAAPVASDAPAGTASAAASSAVGSASGTSLPASAAVSGSDAASAPGRPGSAASAVRAASGATAAVRSASAASAAALRSSSARPALRPASARVEASAPAAVSSHGSPASTPAQEQVKAAASSAPAGPAAAAGNRAIGPSSPGQVCADRVFVFRVTCIAEQCNSEQFRNSEECLKFREMARKREVNRPDN